MGRRNITNSLCSQLGYTWHLLWPGAPSIPFSCPCRYSIINSAPWLLFYYEGMKAWFGLICISAKGINPFLVLSSLNCVQCHKEGYQYCTIIIPKKCKALIDDEPPDTDPSSSFLHPHLLSLIFLHLLCLTKSPSKRWLSNSSSS